MEIPMIKRKPQRTIKQWELSLDLRLDQQVQVLVDYKNSHTQTVLSKQRINRYT